MLRWECGKSFAKTGFRFLRSLAIITIMGSSDSCNVVQSGPRIGKTDAPMPEKEKKQIEDQHSFHPYKPKNRKSGTGGIQLNDHLWEGKYSPRDAYGKRISRNVYAKTREECEAKLAAMIEEMKKQIAEEKAMLKTCAAINKEKAFLWETDMIELEQGVIP